MLDLAIIREVEQSDHWPNGVTLRDLALFIGEGANKRKFMVCEVTEVVPDKVFLFRTVDEKFLIAVDHPLWRLYLWPRPDVTIRGDASEQYIPRMFAKCR